MLRKLALIAHRYIGVLVGLLLVIIALSGSSLVFANEIDAWLSPNIFRVTPQIERVSLDSVVKTVQANYPSQKLVNILLPKTPHGVYRIMADDYKFSIYANPYTGEVLTARPWNQTYRGWMFELHSQLFAGKIGETIVGLLGLLLLVLSVTGVMLWPGWRRFGAGWKIRFSAPKSIVNYDLHKVIGIVSVAFIIFIAFTGVALTFFAEFIKLTHWLTQTSEIAHHVEIPASNQSLPLDELIHRADVTLPGAKTVLVGLPETPQTAIQIGKKFPQELDEFGWSVVHLNQYTGEVLLVENALKASLAKQIIGVIYPLHVGAAGGLGVKSFYVLLGLTPITLFITGFGLWWSRTYGLRRTKQ